MQVVLMRPRGAGNLGSVARALKNCGLSRLTLVDPRIRNWTEAWMMAVHAEDVLRETVSVPTLDEALATSVWVVGTSMRPLGGQRVLTPREVAEQAVARGAVTLVFGDEESGLTNAELMKCHDVSRIPTSSAQPSLNLAQAVMVHAYELFVASGAGVSGPVVELADGAMLGRVEVALRKMMVVSGFSDVDRPRHGVTELMQTLRRAGLTDVEARLWLVALKKAGREPG